MAEQEGHVLLVHGDGDGDLVRLQHLAYLDRASGTQQPAVGNGADQPVAGIDDEDVVELFRQDVLFPFRAFADEVDGLPYGPEGRHVDQFPLHQTAGAVLRVGERLLDEGAVLGRDGVQDFPLVVGVQVLDDVDGVVGVHPADRLGDVGDADVVDQPFEDGLVQFGEDRGVQPVAQDVDHGDAIVRGQALQMVGDVGGVQRLHQFQNVVGASRGQGADDSRFQPVAGAGAPVVCARCLLVGIGRVHPLFSRTSAPVT